MEPITDSFVERLQKTSRCRPEIRELAKDMASLSPPQYDTLVAELTESGEDHALGILLNVAALNQIKLDPSILAKALGVVEIIVDIKGPYNFQDETAIAPLLTEVMSEGLSGPRQCTAARLAVELALKFSSPAQPIKRVIRKRLEDVGHSETRMLFEMALSFLENKDAVMSRPIKRMIGGEILSDVPEEKPAVVIGHGYTVKRPVAKLGRNEPCHCGSGKKYKKCCFDNDQKTLRDATPYEGITRSQLSENPSLVEDTSYIEGLRAYELKKLVPSKLNDLQLFSAYRCADFFGLRDIAFLMLEELKGRPEKAQFATDHMQDLFNSALSAQDIETVQKLAVYLPEDMRYYEPADKLRHDLLEQPDKFADLEAICRKTFDENNKEHHLLGISIAFEEILPALSVIFGRAAIVSEPDRFMDNELLIETIHKGRIAMEIEPEGDPIEDYWERYEDDEFEREGNKEKDEEIRKLQEQLAESRGKGLSAQKDLQEKVKELNGLEKKLQAVNTLTPVIKVERTMQPLRTTEQVEEITALRKKIEGLKVEISSQQESRRQLRKDLQQAQEVISKQHAENMPEEDMPSDEPEFSHTIPEKVRVPDFTDTFRDSCEDLPADIVIKAMEAAVGFVSRDRAVLRQTKGLERMPDYYRIKITRYYRLIIRKTQKNGWQILDVIQRKDLEAWIKRHGH